MARIACLFLSLIFSSPLYAVRQTWLDPHFVQQAFLEVALKNEHQPGDKPLAKWHQPLKIWLQHKVGDQALHESLVDAHIQHLQQITGHPIYRVSTRQQANVVWIFTRESQWQQDIREEMGQEALKYVRGAICKASYSVSPRTNEIIKASVIIPVDQSRSHGKLLACIVEEITQVMGLPNDSELAYPSIFNDYTPDDFLSPLDVVLLKLLYEPKLKSGMNQQQVTQQLKFLLQRYQHDEVLKDAVTVARSAPLRKMLE